MEFISEEIAGYCTRHSSNEPPLLQQLSRDTHARILNPRMLSGHLQGRLLAMISNMIKPSYILEIGTYTGYSALCLCEGLAPDGQLITIDINDELEDFSASYFKKSPWHQQIHQYTGDAIEIIPSLKPGYDLVFIDADKDRYPQYLDLILPGLKKGGFIIADNVLWSGHVLHPEERQDEETKQLILFNQQAVNHPDLEVVMLPVRDGLSILRKK